MNRGWEFGIVLYMVGCNEVIGIFLHAFVMKLMRVAMIYPMLI